MHKRSRLRKYDIEISAVHWILNCSSMFQHFSSHGRRIVCKTGVEQQFRNNGKCRFGGSGKVVCNGDS